MADSREPKKRKSAVSRARSRKSHPEKPSAPTREPPNLAGTVPPFKPTARHFRRTIPPTPIEPYEIRHPAVPESLDGLTILHVSDLHARRKWPIGPGFRRAREALEATTADLILLTGDYMDRPGDEAAAVRVLEFLARSWKPRYGAYAIFGNHDSWLFRRQAVSVAGITWLEGPHSRAVPIPGAPLTLLGFDEPEDVLGTVLQEGADPNPRPHSHDTATGASRKGRRRTSATDTGAHLPMPDAFCIALAHYPSEIYAAADLGIPLMMAGHTHGGQWRLSPSMAPHTSSDLPPDLASGLLRFRGSLCAISRGLGYAALEFRFNCPPQIPLYTLRRGPLPGAAADGLDRLCCALPW